jgi:hypothetical protein
MPILLEGVARTSAASLCGKLRKVRKVRKVYSLLFLEKSNFRASVFR